MQGLIDGADYYAKAVIPAGTYSNQKKDATTFGKKATVVTSYASEELVYLVTKAVMENLMISERNILLSHLWKRKI